MKAIINGKIILTNTILEGKVLLFDNQILDIVDEAPSNAEIIDAKGNFVSPGFIDEHIHGSGGCDVMDGNTESIDTISKTIAKMGVTGYLATTMTMSKEAIYKALDACREAMAKKPVGAKVLGVHMEGPFINVKRKGAQNEKYVQIANFEDIKDYLDVVKFVTIAPEVDKNHSFLHDCKCKSDIVVSMGHTSATFEEAMDAIDHGVTHVTHLFNAMTPLTHREPGVVGAAFATDVYAELIADKIHVHPGIFQVVLNNKGKSKLVLVTDSMKAGCMKDGKYDLGGQDVFVKDNAARLEDGTLAGSVLTLNKAVKNFYENSKLELHEAVALASLNTANGLGIGDKKGSLDIGKDADIIIFDKNFDVLETIVEGDTVFKAN